MHIHVCTCTLYIPVHVWLMYYTDIILNMCMYVCAAGSTVLAIQAPEGTQLSADHVSWHYVCVSAYYNSSSNQ